MEDWLYEDGEDETKSTYIAKLKELKTVGDPIEQRAADDAGRPEVINELRTLASQYQQVATSELPAHAHLSEEDRGTLLKESEAALAWLNEKISLQSQVGGGVLADV
jgi:heat shock protein 4